MSKIGIIRESYLEERNFLRFPPDGFSYELMNNKLDLIPSLFNRFGVNLWNQRSWFIHLAVVSKKRGIDGFHFFNHLSTIKKPWFVTFEGAVPRWNADSQFGLKLLASHHCKALIAMSEAAYQSQIRVINDNPRFRKIVDKLEILHPPQELLVENYDLKPQNGNDIQFVLVGHEFFRKGGREILDVFDTLLKEGAPIRLKIVSRLITGDYASHATEQDLINAKTLIAKYPDHIQHWESLPNQQVLNLLRESHVGLLPTYSDTYGFFALEAQAAGCPVISTNVRALPEINNDQYGWLIDLPLSVAKYVPLNSTNERQAVSDLIKSRLDQIVRNILDNPSSIRSRGERCIERIKMNHSPQAHSQRLGELYRASMAK